MSADVATPSKGLKVALIIVRTLMGLLFLFASITYFFHLMPPPPTTGAMKVFNDGLMASRYLMPTAKTVELLCGLAFVTGRFVPLAAVLIAPIIVNILLISVFMGPEGLPVSVFLVLADAFIAYYHWDRFRPLLQA